MKKISIFVSNRIDQSSYRLPSSLYIPVRCGAVFDEKKTEILGDDTGDNISEKRNHFCELTVQYWAWKNWDSDYYGLCHYRRFLSFSENSDQKYGTNDHNQINVPLLNRRTAMELGLLDEQKIRQDLRDYDVITGNEFDVSNVMTRKGLKENVYEHWMVNYPVLITRDCIDQLLMIIDEKYPSYRDIARDILNSRYFTGHNLYIMKRDIFFEFCEFQFSILFEFEKHINYSNLNEQQQRTPGFMGEILFDIFIRKLEQDGIHKVKRRQIVFFQKTFPVFQKKYCPNHRKVILIQIKEADIPYAGVLLQSLTEAVDQERIETVLLAHYGLEKAYKNAFENIVRKNEKLRLEYLDLRNYSNYIQSENKLIPLLPWILKKTDRIIVLPSHSLITIEGYHRITNWNQYKSAVILSRPIPFQNSYLHENENNMNGVVLLHADALRRSYSFNEVFQLLKRETKLKDIYKRDLSWLPYSIASPFFSAEKRIRDLALVPKNKQQYFNGNAFSVLLYKSAIYSMKTAEWLMWTTFWEYAKKTDFYHMLQYHIFEKKLDFHIPDKEFNHYDDMESKKIMDKLGNTAIRKKIINSVIPLHSRRREFIKKIINTKRK